MNEGKKLNGLEVSGAGSVLVAIATYQRADDLAATLRHVGAELSSASVPAGLLVVDNDPAGSARDVVAAAAQRLGVDIRYVVEPTPGIAAARNRALDEADGAELLIFIDDDEHPQPGWLTALLNTHASTGATAVAGAVISEYDGELEPWVAAGRFFDRRRLPTGTPIEIAATNNLLLDLRRLRGTALRFDAAFGLTGGSDTLFTRQLTRLGHLMVWCDEAVVVDRVPVSRTSRDWVLRRAYRSGNTASRVAVTLAARGTDRVVVRVRFALRGAARIAAGGLRLALGTAGGSLVHRVRGRRAVSRGAGMIAGASGRYLVEYARSNDEGSQLVRPVAS